MTSVLALDLPALAAHRELSDSSDYRFFANIASADVDRAQLAVRLAGPIGNFRLVPIVCADLGLPVRGAALYVLSKLPDADLFWRFFDSLK